MEYRRVGRTDLCASSIGLGCVTFGREIDQTSSFAVMDRAAERGINLLDTAEAYGRGRSEEVVGAWLTSRGMRDQVILATKALPPHGARLIQAAEASLRRLQTDVIDLYQLHAWDGSTSLEETLAALNTLVTQGKIRHIGCSNFMAWQICRAHWISEVNGWARLESVQPNYNLVVRDIEKELLPFCADQEVGVITYSPLGAGFLTGKHRRGQEPPDHTRFSLLPGHQPIYYHDVGWRILEGLRAQADISGRSMIEMALAWVIGQPGITSVLIGARTTAHVDQAFQAEAVGLSPELHAALSNL